jgi:uncharacterized protein (DUF1697 family)
MVTFVALLRGINVGRHRRIKMDDLKTLLVELGFTDIQTYIQSGNLVFQCGESDSRAVGSAIREKIRQKYDYDVPVIMLTPVELRRVVEDNPLIKLPEKRLNVTFLEEIPSQVYIDKLEKVVLSPEQFSLKGRAVYQYSPEGYKKKKLSNALFEKALNVSATTRGWSTVKRLRAMVNR